jgi:hypothetical protein
MRPSRTQRYVLRIKGRERIVQLPRERGSCVPIGHHLDIGAGSTGLGSLDDLIELAACGHARGQPAVATERLGELVVMTLSEIIVVLIGILAEQPLDQIPVIV